MAKWQFRRSKKIGPFRLNLSKRGLSVSGGVPGARVSVNSRGQVHQTLGVPGTGLYKRSRLAGGDAGDRGAPDRNVELTVLDGTGGSRALLDGDPDVEGLAVVDVSRTAGGILQVAAVAGLTEEKPQAIRSALLIPKGDQVTVMLLIEPDENPSLFDRRQRKEGSPRAVEIGRLGAKAAQRIADLAGDRETLAVVYIDTRPMREHLEARVRLSALADHVDERPPERDTSQP